MNHLEIARRGAHAVTAYGDPDLDDLIQEAAIEVAKVAERLPEAGEDYLVGVAKMRTRKILSEGRRWSGMPKRTAQALDPLRRTDTAGLDALRSEPPAPDETDGVEWAVIGVEIEAALRGLAPAQRASALGVAQGMTWAEIGRRRGVAPQSARESWLQARAHLQPALAHLEDALR